MANNLFSKAEILALKKSIVGDVKAWEDIATVTIEESVSSITVDKDDDGNPFSLSHITLECIIPNEEKATQRSIYFANSTNISTIDSFSRIPTTTSASYPIEASTYAHIISGRILCESGIYSITNNRYQASAVYAILNGYCSLMAESFDSICIFTYNDALPVGTKVILRGIRK